MFGPDLLGSPDKTQWNWGFFQNPGILKKTCDVQPKLELWVFPKSRDFEKKHGMFGPDFLGNPNNTQRGWGSFPNHEALKKKTEVEKAYNVWPITVGKSW